MMNFTKDQKDVLLEVCNIGISKSAKQLSVLLNGPVLLSSPDIEVIDYKCLNKYTLGESGSLLSMVHQQLTNDFVGQVFLVLQRDYTQFLLEQIIGEIPPNLSDLEKRSCEKEAILEIGNILISSCVTCIANMFNKKVSLTVPSYYEGEFSKLIHDENKYFVDLDAETVIILSMKMSTKRGDFSGRLVLLFSPATVSLILESINAMT